MKFLYALIFLTVCSWSNAQDDFPIYHWEELPDVFGTDTIYGLSLSRMKLTEVPEDLVRFKNLVSLDLGKNKISELPDFI